MSLIDHYDKLLGEVELSITRTAKAHAMQTFSPLQSVPGIGQILAPGLLHEIQDITRFPRVQDFVSSCRLVKCAKESAGRRIRLRRHRPTKGVWCGSRAVSSTRNEGSRTRLAAPIHRSLRGGSPPHARHPSARLTPEA